MGINGLLPLLKSIQRPCSLRSFQGQTLGVDVYCWLHRGAVACAAELALGKPTRKYVDFAMHRVRMLVHFGITPYLVFDGDYLPSKAHTEVDRAERRRLSKASGLELLRAGRTTLAQQQLQKAIEITPEMARQLIDELKEARIQYIVAPYEADAQLVYLEQKGLIDGIISEDSDILVFGANRLLTKLDQYGECVSISKDDYTACKDVNLVGWTISDFRRMAILSGCDYLKGLPSFGLKTAHRYVRKYKQIDRILRAAALDGKMHIPQDYEKNFTQAELTFLYQWVFCPQLQKVVHLNEPIGNHQLEGVEYIGQYVEQEVARGVASGELNPSTKEKIVTQSFRPTGARAIGFQSNTSAVQSAKKEPEANTSITTFFKVNRTPLSELDPNKFAPNASQSAVVFSNIGRSWPSVLAPPRASSTNISPSITRTNRPAQKLTPAFQSVKRSRLCTDSGSTVSYEVSNERSKFFNTQSTPSQDSEPNKKRKTDDAIEFLVHSDDSIEEALKALPDVANQNEVKVQSSAREVKRKMRIHRDSGISMSPVQPTSHNDGRAGLAEKDLSPFSDSLLQQTSELRAKFNFSQTSIPDSPTQERKKHPTANLKSQTITGLPTPPLSMESSVMSITSLSRKEDGISNESRIAIDELLKDDTNSTEQEVGDLPKMKNSYKRFGLEAKGSEDLMVPNSDAGSDDDGQRLEDICVAESSPHRRDNGNSSPSRDKTVITDDEFHEDGEAQSPAKPVLNLQRFLCSAGSRSWQDSLRV